MLCGLTGSEQLVQRLVSVCPPCGDKLQHGFQQHQENSDDQRDQDANHDPQFGKQDLYFGYVPAQGVYLGGGLFAVSSDVPASIRARYSAVPLMSLTLYTMGFGDYKNNLVTATMASVTVEATMAGRHWFSVCIFAVAASIPAIVDRIFSISTKTFAVSARTFSQKSSSLFFAGSAFWG